MKRLFLILIGALALLIPSATPAVALGSSGCTAEDTKLGYYDASAAWHVVDTTYTTPNYQTGYQLIGVPSWMAFYQSADWSDHNVVAHGSASGFRMRLNQGPYSSLHRVSWYEGIHLCEWYGGFQVVNGALITSTIITQSY